MKYSDLVKITEESKEGKINWKSLVLKPMIYGAIYGAGCYAITLFLKSPLGS